MKKNDKMNINPKMFVVIHYFINKKTWKQEISSFTKVANAKNLIQGVE